MKNVLKLFGVAAIITVIGLETANAQTVNLDIAIQRIAMELSVGIERGARIAVVEMEAGSTAMSNYLIGELNIAFMRMGFTAVDISQLDIAEMNVQFIVRGAFASLGGFYQFRAQITETETGTIHSIHTANVQHDIVIASLLGTAERGAAPEGVPTPIATSRENWISAQFAGGSGFGATVRYERDLSNFFSLGGAVSYFNSNVFTYFGGMVVTRLFLGRLPVFLELGLGGAYTWYEVTRHSSWSSWTEEYTAFAFLLTPAIGVRLGGQRVGFFATPFISLPLAFGDFDTEARFQFGIAVGGAW